MGRYKNKRELINWERSSFLMAIKALAGLLHRYEGRTGEMDLWRRMEELYPIMQQDIQNILPMAVDWPHTFEEVRGVTEAAQGGKKITPRKLGGRGDVVFRKGYNEKSILFPDVLTWYEAHRGISTGNIDPRHSFEDWMVKQRAKEQLNRCYYCPIEFSDNVLPVGDHLWPRALGGRTDLANCVATDARCNQQKGTMPPDDFKRKLNKLLRRGRRGLVS